MRPYTVTDVGWEVTCPPRLHSSTLSGTEMSSRPFWDQGVLSITHRLNIVTFVQEHLIEARCTVSIDYLLLADLLRYHHFSLIHVAVSRLSLQSFLHDFF